MLKHIRIPILSLLLFSPYLVVAEDQPTIIATGDWAPFTGKSLLNGGMLVEVVEAALKQTKHRYKIDYLPWKRAYKSLIEGNIAASFPWMLTEERQKLFSISDSIYKSTERFFVSKNFSIDYKKDQDIKGLRVCLPLGWTQAPIQKFLDKKTLSLYQPKTEEDCFEAITLKRADLYSVNSISGWEAIRKAGLKSSDFKILGPVIRENTFVLLASKEYKNSAELIKDLNEGLRVIKNKGIYQKIVDKHISAIQGK
ncbi:transporter substrate-binding domain-containing protein [Endozoicomonas sp. SM1973]|uniref:Transporter substrate-binding domain-containing protein n=1 Tax=Spartinivicinus marinus TaxID=2994442 RepID=A0A853I8Y9_9GAMM|nr:transporter substrate-binding domain-containing protein [Spartinivicinus marinus]MCX4027485.1 transporter substrate-binding domain-containing protein [Spartinivicinus marinus]NYZ69773.1 transporter substrate-binding domain-containing protein [Spartinivicinus marinus]